MIFRNILDLFDQYFPGEASILDYLRRARADTRALMCTFKSGHDLEKKLPWLTLEVTNICNSKCRFCAYQYQNRFRLEKSILSVYKLY
jgi:hypothetical protein